MPQGPTEFRTRRQKTDPPGAVILPNPKQATEGAKAAVATPVAQPAEDGVLPDEEKLQRLPVAVVLGFGCRCVRRVLPIVKQFWPGIPPKHHLALRRSVAIAELVATTGTAEVPPLSAVDKAAKAAQLATRRNRPVGDPGYCGIAAVLAAEAILELRRSVNASGAVIVSRAAKVVQLCKQTAKEINEDHVATISAAINLDFETFCRISQLKHWDAHQLLPSDGLGPLWPHGTPAGWPPDETESNAQLFRPSARDPYDLEDRLAAELDAAFDDEQNEGPPSIEALQGAIERLLRRWAQVAVVLRLAERCVPLFDTSFPDASAKHVRAIHESLSHAKMAVTEAHHEVTMDGYAEDANAALPAVQECRLAYIGGYVAYAAAKAASVALSPVPTRPADLAFQALRAVSEIGLLLPAAFPPLCKAVESDIALFANAGYKGHWTDLTPVPADLLNKPLWPKGPPQGWPSVEKSAIIGQLMPGPPETVQGILGKLRIAAKESGLTYEQLGKRIGWDERYSRSNLSRILGEKSDNDPRLGTVLQIATALNIRLRDLL